MLNAKELRSGNLLYFKGTQEVCEVYCIVDDAFDCRTKEKKTVYGEYEPIPLTEEWLLKCGFKPDESNIPEEHVEWYNLNGFSISYCYDMDKTWMVFMQIANKKESIKLAHINHVHQLQNLFQILEGEELNISL